MHTRAVVVLAGELVALSGCTPLSSQGGPAEPAVAPPRPSLVLEDLLTSPLEGAVDAEVVVSRITVPPNAPLPRHWRRGEEFAYVLEGSVVLWQQGKGSIVGAAGDVVKVPVKQVHTATTEAQGATLLVFRVHASGVPGRTPVE